MHLICSEGAGRVAIVQIYKSEHEISGGCDLVESLAHLWVFGHCFAFLVLDSLSPQHQAELAHKH